jgi:hypothetical protein
MRGSRIAASFGSAFIIMGVACASNPATDIAAPRPISIVAEAGAGPIDGGPTSTEAGASVEQSEADRRAEKRIQKMLRRVERARNVTANRKVRGRVLPRSELLGLVRAHVVREIPPEVIENDGRTLVLLGFAPTSFDYLETTFRLLEAQLAGLYEPNDETMYMADDLDEDNAKATLSHELVHALQDQLWDLKPQSHHMPGQSDRSAALSALAEGDATSAMTDVMMEGSGRTAIDVSDDLVAATMQAGIMGEDDGIPTVLKKSLVAPYVEGLRFVHALRRDGGWKSVAGAWTRRPKTTEQILHPGKWRVDEPAEAVPGASSPPIPGSWSLIDTDTMGELDWRLSLGEWVGDDQAAAQLAAGWGGDTSAMFANADTIAFTMRVRYDKKVGTTTGEKAARFTFAKVAGNLSPKARAKTESFFCVERPDRGPLAFAVDGRDIVVVAGPATVKPAWKSAATCSAVRPWALSMATQH